MRKSGWFKKLLKQRSHLWLTAILLVGFALTGCVCYKKTKGVTPVPFASSGPLLNRLNTLSTQKSSAEAPTSFSRPSISRDEELWVIARTDEDRLKLGEDTPSSGALLAKLPKQSKEVPMPLKHTDVKASVNGYIANVEVTQQFQNPYETKIEAVYVFPLPENAAVNEFIMTIGERRIRGIIRERKEAEEIYQAAKTQGYVASLLTQERPNVFTQSVANIEPGKEIDVNIKYFNTLNYSDGWYEFVFPMVVGPRYNPAGTTNGVGAVPRGFPGASGQSTKVQYLKHGERSGHDISLSLDIHAGVAIEEFASHTHTITKTSASPEHLAVSLSPNDRIPNKDFVLRYRVAGVQIKSNLMTYRDERGGFFTLMLYPPQQLQSLPRHPMEMVFLLDCSGSMSGWPIARAKQAIERVIRQLQPSDTFQIINFSEKASRLGPRPIAATSANIRRGLDYLKTLNSDGPTEMVEGIKAALDFPHDPGRLRFVCFMTDGYIGNEAEIFAETHKRLGASRIFSFGVGTAVNRYLLDGVARMGQGAAAYLGPNDSTSEVMDKFFARISHPALTGLKIDWGNLQASDIYPSRLPDLFVGRPVIVCGRFKGSTSTVQVSGRTGENEIQFKLPISASEQTVANKGLPSVWARTKIADLFERAAYETNSDLAGEVKQLALDYNLMSDFTAFIAVDSSRVTEGDSGTTVPVAVPVPEGVKYKTTVPTAKPQ